MEFQYNNLLEVSGWQAMEADGLSVFFCQSRDYMSRLCMLLWTSNKILHNSCALFDKNIGVNATSYQTNVEMKKILTQILLNVRIRTTCI